MAEELKQPYYGRALAIGMTSEGNPFVSYFVTGRSDSSRARKFVVTRGHSNFKIATDATDPEALAEGNPELLLYDAMIALRYIGPRDEHFIHAIYASNGRQTNQMVTDAEIFGLSLNQIQNNWNYEPDSPNWTPRISGVLVYDSGQGIVTTFDIGRIRKDPEHTTRALREFWQLLPESRYAYELATYTGVNVPSGVIIPSSNESPKIFEVTATTLDELADITVERMGHIDFRVAAAVALFNPEIKKFEHKIVNFRGA